MQAPFQIGDLVIPTPENEGRCTRVHGWIRGKELRVFRCYEDSGHWYVRTDNSGVSSYAYRFQLVTPLTKEEQLIKKINQLWKRQPYYKEHHADQI